MSQASRNSRISSVTCHRPPETKSDVPPETKSDVREFLFYPSRILPFLYFKCHMSQFGKGKIKMQEHQTVDT